MKSITSTLDNKYTDSQQFDKTYNIMDHIASSRSVEYHSIGSNVYTATSGASIVKFKLSDDMAWLDPSSVRIQYKITNKAAIVADQKANLYPLRSHGFFTRMRIMSRGTLIEDISDYSRVHEMFENLKPLNKNMSDSLEGFKNDLNLDIPVPVVDPAYVPLAYFTKIEQGSSMVVSFRPFSGIFNQSHYIPLSFLPLEVEFELSRDARFNIISNDSGGGFPGGVYPVANGVSETWEISDFKILCDQKYYSPTYNNMFVDMMSQSNATYKIPINNFTSIYQALQNTLPTEINISRAVHSLDRVYVSFYISPTDASLPDKIKKQVWIKENNFFYSPSIATVIDSGKTLLKYEPLTDIKKLSLRHGSINFPDNALNSNSVCYYYLDKVHPQTSINMEEYFSNKFISVFNLERAYADANTLARGVDTNNANVALSIDFPTVAGKPNKPTYIHVILMNELIINIFNTHIDILE